MKAEIISTGTEILLGHTLDTNSAFISNILSGLGIDVFRHFTVGDNKERLSLAISDALDRSDIVIITGGLGPTVDDITIASLAEVTQRDVYFDKETFKRLKGFFRSRRSSLPSGAIKQALVPRDSEIIKNEFGTAPGIILKMDRKLIVALPGPPGELRPMVLDSIVPYLKKLSGAGSVIRSRGIRLIGLPEAVVNDRSKDLLSLSGDTTVGIYTSPGEVVLRITSKAPDGKRADKELGRIEKVIRTRFGIIVYGKDGDTLESVVGAKLAGSKKTIALAESCTGGILANLITNVPGSSSYFIMGLVAYNNSVKSGVLGIENGIIKKHGAVSREVASLMADNVRKLSGADIGISITGIAGPGGATGKKPVGLVYVALRSAKKRVVKELGLSGPREDIKLKAAKQALDLLRLNI